jgi:hypothetical protein
MFRNGDWRLFAAGAVCGIIFTLAVWAASIGWKPSPDRSAKDSAIYDNCLMAQRGNMVACDAMMRLVERERASEGAMKEEAAKLVAAGVQQARSREMGNGQGFCWFTTERCCRDFLERPSGDKY